MFHQPSHALCTTDFSTISLENFELTISYAEEHDANTVEFTHKHPEFEIVYLMDGSLSLQIDDSLEQVNPGEFLFINKQVDHHILYQPSIPKRYLSILFTFSDKGKQVSKEHGNSTDGLDLISTLLEVLRSHSHFIYKDTKQSNQLISMMYDIVDKKDWGWQYQLQFLYANFIISIMKNFMVAAEPVQHQKAENMGIAFTRFLHQNYQNPNLSVQDLADHFYMSTRHVNRLFKEAFGTSPMKTLTIYRLSYAKNYIQDTDFSLETIAERVGFSSASVLSRLFKEKEGMTISQYKKMFQKIKENDETLKSST